MYLNPVDAMQMCRGLVVVVQLKSGKEFTGKLLSLDEDSNVMVEVDSASIFLQGESINFFGTLAK